MSEHFLICDDHEIVREAIATMLEQAFPDCRIDQADSYTQAWHKLETSRPDLVLCDLVMPGADPAQGIAGLQQRCADVPVCVLTGSQDEEQMVWLLNAGIAGFIGKFSSGDVILAAIRLVLAGGRYVPPEVLAMLGRDSQTPAGLVRLTEQQRKVLALVAKGQPNKAIAQALNVAPSTIKTHLEQAMRALDAASRYEAAAKARTLDLI